jgi:hypothetical protein
VPIYSDKNLYAGINPHLNSYLQNEEGEWESFHSSHITHLLEWIDKQLPEGYRCGSEKSLQISYFAPSFTELPKKSRSVADILIYGQTGNTAVSVAVSPTPPIMTMTLPEDDPDDVLSAITIFRVVAAGKRGEPVTRIELLSPANKPKGTHYALYHHKRKQTLQSGINLVEIDYLHQLDPILPTLPSYARGETDSYPFLVLVSNPHPSYHAGKTDIYGSFVDMPLPTIRLPLAHEESIALDLNPPYYQTAVSTRAFREASDYAQLPSKFEKYGTDDQARIRAKMQTIGTEYSC